MTYNNNSLHQNTKKKLIYPKKKPIIKSVDTKSEETKIEKADSVPKRNKFFNREEKALIDKFYEMFKKKYMILEISFNC